MDMVKNKKGKNILFGFIIVLLSIPMIQYYTQIVNEPALKGVTVNSQPGEFSAQNWFNGSFQSKELDYINENIGFRRDMVMVYNQYYYTVYDEIRAEKVVKGKSGYLYERSYIDAYLGIDFVGEDKIKENIRKIKMISDTLNKLGKIFLPILTPGKGSYFPDFFPSDYDTIPLSKTNYDGYKQGFEELSIQFLDFQQLFLNLKPTSPYPFFPKTGIHWTDYAEVIASDSIMSYLSIALNKPLPRINISKVEKSKKMRGRDEDLEKILNIFTNIPDIEIGYPHYTIQRDHQTKDAKILFVADSFFWGMYNKGFNDKLFGNGGFWYYNSSIWPKDPEGLTVADINIQEKIEEKDVICILCTDGNLKGFGFGVIDQLYDIYFPSIKE